MKTPMTNTKRRRPRSRALSMLLLPILGAGLMACDDDDGHYRDLTPPAIPSGVNSITADELVIVYWTPNREADLTSYSVWRDDDGDDRFDEIARIGARDPAYYDEGDPRWLGDELVIFEDYEVVNGGEYSYAISALDRNGNESELSYEFVLDVPRPEGSLTLDDRFLAPNSSGIDFNRAESMNPISAQAWDAASTDVWFEVVDNGSGLEGYFVTPLPSNAAEIGIQDFGFVGFDVLSIAPLGGWSPTGIVEAIEGHSYAVEIYRDPNGFPRLNYAKFTVDSLDLNAGIASITWGYQAVDGEEQYAKPSGAVRILRALAPVPMEVTP